jgi:hypothetical protein
MCYNYIYCVQTNRIPFRPYLTNSIYLQTPLSLTFILYLLYSIYPHSYISRSLSAAIRIRFRMDPHYCGQPDLDPHQSQKVNPDPGPHQNSRAVKAKIWRRGGPRTLTVEARSLKMEPWRTLIPHNGGVESQNGNVEGRGN